MRPFSLASGVTPPFFAVALFVGVCGCDDGVETTPGPGPSAGSSDSGGTEESSGASETGGAANASGDESSGSTGTGAGESSGSSGAAEPGFCEVNKIMQARCVSCHDGNGTGGAPMALADYEDFVADAPGREGQKIYDRVAFRIDPDNAQSEGLPLMPPPPGQVTAAEIATVQAWAAAGAPDSDVPCDAGDDSASRKIVNTEWPPAGCDDIYEIRAHAAGDPGTPLAVTRDSPTDPNSHPQVIMDAPWGDEPVQAIAYLPLTDNAEVLHHWILYAAGRSTGAGFLTGWAPGDDGRTDFPDDVGMNMPPRLRLDMHYYNNSNEVAYDQSGVAICVVRGDNRRDYAAGVTTAFTRMNFQGSGNPMAPAHTQNHAITGVCEVETDTPVTLLNASPHAHTYAVHTKFTLTKQDGREVTMLDAPFQFGEQASYELDPPLVIETGDVVTTTCLYTNNTSKDVYFGDATDDEMCFNFATYYPHGALRCRGGFGGFFGR